MLYGCCTNLLPREPGSIGEEYFETLARLGYDYVELPLYDVAALSPQQLREAKARLRQTLPVRSCNNFFPASVRLVGQDTAPMEKVREYTKHALACAAELGASIAVFGSPWAKLRPQGFAPEKAFAQLAAVCRMLGEEAQSAGIMIALEPNNRTETNMINTYAEVLQLIEAANHPCVRGLQDYFHLKKESDTVESLLRGKDQLIHTHFARLEGRRYPKCESEDPYYKTYFQTLAETGYQGGVSVEGVIESKEAFAKDAADTLAFFKGFQNKT